jgi:hypothetical protein
MQDKREQEMSWFEALPLRGDVRVAMVQAFPSGMATTRRVGMP